MLFHFNRPLKNGAASSKENVPVVQLQLVSPGKDAREAAMHAVGERLQHEGQPAGTLSLLLCLTILCSLALP